MSFYYVFETAFGFCGIAWNEKGVSRFLLPLDAAEAVSERLVRNPVQTTRTEPSDIAAQAVMAAQRYFAGEREDFSAIAVNLENIAPFRRAIYQAARKLGYGETTTYGALAAEAGFPQAARETGTALGRNPVPLIIPCHRVLAAGGKLGGFSAPGGTTTKKKMLSLEHAAPPSTAAGQASFAF